MESHNRSSILFVEDDRTSREVLADMLAVRFPDVSFHLADNGLNGLDAFRDHTPPIVITDLNMPVMDGFRMAEAIKAIRPETTIIALTAFSDTPCGTPESALRCIDHFVLKPVDYRKLLALIDNCLATSADVTAP